MRGVDEILILDVTATQDRSGPDLAMIEKLTDTARVPVTVGGGIRDTEDVRRLLGAGADKVCIRWPKSKLIREVSEKFGSQCVTVSLNIRMSATYFGEHIAAEYGARLAEENGAGEILLQAVDVDGTMRRYDVPLIKAVSQEVNIPVIASGGCSGYEDMYTAIDAGADAVAAGALFQFTNATPAGAAEYLHNRGVEVRHETC